MIHFSLFQISPYFLTNFRLHNIFSNFTVFQQTFSVFVRHNFWWPFLVIASEFRISPLFSINRTFPARLFRENYYFLSYFWKFLLNFVKFTYFYIFFVFRFLPALKMRHLCITQCTYWTPLPQHSRPCNNTTACLLSCMSSKQKKATVMIVTNAPINLEL